MGLAPALGDMGTNSGACTLNLKGVAGADDDDTTTSGLSPPSAAASSELLLWVPLELVVVVHLTSLLSCAMAVAVGVGGG